MCLNDILSRSKDIAAFLTLVGLIGVFIPANFYDEDKLIPIYNMLIKKRYYRFCFIFENMPAVLSILSWLTVLLYLGYSIHGGELWAKAATITLLFATMLIFLVICICIFLKEGYLQKYLENKFKLIEQRAFNAYDDDKHKFDDFNTK